MKKGSECLWNDRAMTSGFGICDKDARKVDLIWRCAPTRVWQRRGWDSNPRTLAGLRFSRPVQ